MPDLAALLHQKSGPTADFLRDAANRIQQDRKQLAVLFPQLPRRLGKDSQRLGSFQSGDLSADLDAFRRCDLGAFLLLQESRATDAEQWDLYEHGDLEERAMLLRSQALLPLTKGTVRLLGEVQRTNVVLHVEAAVCDSNLLARSLDQHGFGLPDWNRLVLKLAFLDLPLARAFGTEEHGNPELSRMLQDLATEREAAGRPVWRDTNRMIGRAPCPGTTARLVGGLEHGDDGQRLAAVEGLRHLGRKDLLPFAAERLPREPRPAIQQALRALLQPNGS
jgi:hypothetical protein